jgi:thiol-disulfide isomerase/thioredoxin
MKGPSLSIKISILCLIIGVTLVFSLYERNQVRSLVERAESGPILKRLPAFETVKLFTKDVPEAFTDLTLKKWNSKLVFVHFWGTWCAPCEAELPPLIKLAASFSKEDMLFLFVAVNDEEAKIDKFMKRFGTLPENVLLLMENSGKMMIDFGTTKVPETYLFNRSGKHLTKFVGPQDWDASSYRERLHFYLSSDRGELVESSVETH